MQPLNKDAISLGSPEGMELRRGIDDTEKA